MKSKPNVAHSVRDRLLKLSRVRGEEFNFVLARYAMERLLYRISKSPYAAEFVLKGAMLFTVWSKLPHRATKDLDLLGSGSPDMSRLAAVFRAIAQIPAEDDGLSFEPATVDVRKIKEDAEYEGVRVKLEGKLGSAKLPIQIDVGFGDSVVPPPSTVEFPTLLDFPTPIIRAYARETVVAEKLHAMVDLGVANTRLKDFFDIWFLCQEFEFQAALLSRAIAATFERRRTPVPVETPVALTGAFSLDAGKQAQWSAFIKRSRATEKELTLPHAIQTIESFLSPALAGAKDEGLVRTARWSPGGPWFSEP